MLGVAIQGNELSLYDRQDESLLRAHTDVTEALRRTSTLMQQELEKSSYSTSMLGKFGREHRKRSTLTFEL